MMRSSSRHANRPRPRNTLILAAVATVIGAIGGGCIPWSLTVDGPPADYTPALDGPPRCESSAPVRMVVDGLGATGAALGTGVAIAFASDDVFREARGTFTAIAIAGALGVLMHVSSIRTTRRRTHSCERAEQAWRAAGKPFGNEPVPEPPDLTPEEAKTQCAIARGRWRAEPATSPRKAQLLEKVELYCDD